MRTFYDLLEDISVIPAGEVLASDVSEWFVVADNDGVIAYFAREADAFAFRLMVINMALNGAGVTAGRK
jgi:hypothetical protein